MQNHGTTWIVKRILAYSVRAAPKRQSRDFPLSPWLRCCTSTVEAQVQSLVRELRAHKPRDMAKKKKRQGPPQKNPTKQGHLIQLH